MEEIKDNNKNQQKKNSDGLTKKQRKALKLQEIKEQQQQSALPEQKLENKIDDKSEKQLSEKELRRIEWQKKLAEKKTTEENVNLSKTELKNQRREQQEAQRQMKQQKQNQKIKYDEPKKSPIPPDNKKPEIIKKQNTKKIDKVNNKVQLVSHLYGTNLEILNNTKVNYNNIHPEFISLGVQYATKKILGSNARCLALLFTIRQLIEDLNVPIKSEFCRHLDNVLTECIEFLQNFRPFAVSMTNALRYFKVQLNEKAHILKENEKKTFLLNIIDTYVSDQIYMAGEAISLKVKEKIADKGDVLLTFGCSSLIKKILFDAHKAGKEFSVIIVDSRPLMEGRQLLQRLVKLNIKCIYVQITAITYVMSLATKVLLGAHALLANGYVMSRIGTGQIAMMAKSFNKPVLVCCETYKFSERVQTDSFVYNEIGDNNLLTTIDTLDYPSPLIKQKNNQKLTFLNLLYDVTPPDFVTAVVTELSILPCTSVPVVLRIKPTEMML